MVLHVCHRSYSLTKRLLKRIYIQIPGVPGRKTLYLNQACDFFAITKLDMQINLKISRFVADPTLINRVVISGIVLNEASLNMIYYCDHLPRLQELVLTDRALHYLIYKRTFSGRKYCKVSPGTSELVRSYYGSYPLFYYDYRPISGIRGCGIKLLLSSNITSRVWKQRVQGNLFAGFIRTKVEGTQNTKHLNK